MKTTIYLILLAVPLLAISSCSDDDKKSTQKDCNCHYTLVEGGQLQEGYTEPSDTTDCSLDGVKVYYPDYMNGQPNDTYYRMLDCNEK